MRHSAMTAIVIVIVVAACATPKPPAPAVAQPAPCSGADVYGAIMDCMTRKTPAPAVAPLAPCSGDSTIYTYADSVLGVHPAEVTGASVPRMDVNLGSATIRLLIASDGHVVRDSAQIVRTTNQAFASTVLRATLEWTFSPASRNGCAVAFWYEVTMDR